MSHEVNEQLIEKVYHETLAMSVDAFADELMKLGYTYVLNDLIKKVAANKYENLPEGDHNNG
jgi:hypothetical protein